jgi:hypothetical protein
MLTDQVPSVVPVFLNVISTTKFAFGFLSTTPLQEGKQADNELFEPTLEMPVIMINAVTAKANTIDFFIILASPT